MHTHTQARTWPTGEAATDGSAVRIMLSRMNALHAVQDGKLMRKPAPIQAPSARVRHARLRKSERVSLKRRMRMMRNAKTTKVRAAAIVRARSAIMAERGDGYDPRTADLMRKRKHVEAGTHRHAFAYDATAYVRGERKRTPAYPITVRKPGAEPVTVPAGHFRERGDGTGKRSAKTDRQAKIVAQLAALHADKRHADADADALADGSA